MDNKKYYVYAHIDPEGKVFYIGKGLDDRAYDHIGRSEAWKAHVRPFKERGLPISVLILHTGKTEQEALSLEEMEIVLRLKAGEPLVNQAHKKSCYVMPIEQIDVSRLCKVDNWPKAFREIRKAKGITIERLAALSDFSRDVVIRFEQGKTDISLKKFLRLLYMCNVDLFIKPNLKYCPYCQSPKIREKMNSYVCASCGKNWDRASAEYKNKDNK